MRATRTTGAKQAITAIETAVMAVIVIMDNMRAERTTGEKQAITAIETAVMAVIVVME